MPFRIKVVPDEHLAVGPQLRDRRSRTRLSNRVDQTEQRHIETHTASIGVPIGYSSDVANSAQPSSRRQAGRHLQIWRRVPSWDASSPKAGGTATAMGMSTTVVFGAHIPFLLPAHGQPGSDTVVMIRFLGVVDA